jgi:hypothetical protein
MCLLNFNQQAVFLAIRAVYAAFSLSSVARACCPHPWAQHLDSRVFSDSAPQQLISSGLSTVNAVLIHLITVAVHSHPKISDKFNRQKNVITCFAFPLTFHPHDKADAISEKCSRYSLFAIGK